MVFALRKNSPGTELVNYVCQQAVETGLMGSAYKHGFLGEIYWDCTYIFFTFRKFRLEYLPSEALLKAKQPALGLAPISLVNFLTSKLKFPLYSISIDSIHATRNCCFPF